MSKDIHNEMNETTVFLAAILRKIGPVTLTFDEVDEMAGDLDFSDDPHMKIKMIGDDLIVDFEV